VQAKDKEARVAVRSRIQNRRTEAAAGDVAKVADRRGAEETRRQCRRVAVRRQLMGSSSAMPTTARAALK